MRTRFPSIAAVVIALTLAACSAGPPPAQIAEARIAIQEAERARANELATREYDEAVRHLSVAESTWKEKHDEATAAHYARRAEAAAHQAQSEAEARTAEEEIRLQTERRHRAELSIRDAEIARLHSEARTEAEQRAAEAEAVAREERERREAAAEQARIEAEARRSAEERAREADQMRMETEARAAEERERREEERRAAEERRAQEAQQAEEARRAQEEQARAAEIARLREEQERTREELRATLSRLAEVRQEARGLVLTLPGSVYFEVNKSIVQPAMRSRLTEIARALSAAGDDAHLLIEGHTDADGSSEYNLELSRLRAEAVRSVLVAGGVPPDRIETQGYGETRPIASNRTATGKAQNRRVEIVVQGSALAPAR
jgi:outer membrane protein OmpA-like peptidoglycan-associated protein